MKKLLFILLIAFSFTAKAQMFTPLDTTISGIRYKFYIDKISYSLTGDSLYSVNGFCPINSKKKSLETVLELL